VESIAGTVAGLVEPPIPVLGAPLGMKADLVLADASIVESMPLPPLPNESVAATRGSVVGSSSPVGEALFAIKGDVASAGTSLVMSMPLPMLPPMDLAVTVVEFTEPRGNGLLSLATVREGTSVVVAVPASTAPMALAIVAGGAVEESLATIAVDDASRRLGRGHW